MPRPSNSYTGGSGRKRGKPARRSGGAGRLLTGIALGVLLTLTAIAAYFYFGRPPVAATDKSAWWEGLIGRVATERRMQRDSKAAPFPADEDAFEGAARTYRSQCVQCHGSPSQNAEVGATMLPAAPQFFGRDRRSTASRSAGELYWATAFGIRRSGMPAYRQSLTNTQLWQLALLLHSADQELPDPVRNLLAPVIPAMAPTNQPPMTARRIAAVPKH